LEAHERKAHPLHFFVAQCASFHSPHRLSFEQLSQEVNECEDELGESMLDTLGIHIHALGQNATKSLHLASQVIELGVHRHSVLANV
jgi:hypothetical protein